MNTITDPTFDWWLCGYLAGHKGSTVADAVRAWQEQERLQAEFEAERDAYCIRGGCGQRATHEVTLFNAETDQVVWVYATCKLHAPAFLMGHRENQYARFRLVA